MTHEGCPCLYVTSCCESCTCANPLLSGGCLRCCRYGSLEQRKATAQRLAGMAAERNCYVETLEQYADPESWFHERTLDEDTIDSIWGERTPGNEPARVALERGAKIREGK